MKRWNYRGEATYNAVRMKFAQTQQLKLAQQMKLSPRILQAMEILQLPVLQLQERIEAELESNPVLELDDGLAQSEMSDETWDESDGATETAGEQELVVDAQGDSQDDFERLDEFVDEYRQEMDDYEPDPRPPAATVSDEDPKLSAFANTPARTESLNDHLREQWAFMDVGPALDQAGKRIIDEIEEDGYFRTPLESLVTEEDGQTLSVLAEALKRVQTLDPIGVGARDLRECLLIQLSAESEAGRDVTLEIQLVDHFLREIEMNHLPAIARKLDRDIEEIKTGIENLSHLNPRPGHLIGGSTAPGIRPDVVVELQEGVPVVMMPDGDTPMLRISPEYQEMAKDKKADKQTRQFVRENVRSAQWLISAVDQRRATLAQVTQAVFDVQVPFLSDGPEALRPLPMSQVAEVVGIHVATVSRAVAGKYVQTPRGIFPLRMFFSGGTTSDDGQDVAWEAVKARLQEIVDNEDKSKPLSDDRLSEELATHGLSIARRTVAKYRGLLDIPPARKRREY
jgi:RNA polymerase sigma-54 factor